MISISKSILASVLLAGTLAACAQGKPSIDEAAIKAEITDVLNTQDAAWNRGDIDAFMEDYFKSEDLRFASAGSVSRGW